MSRAGRTVAKTEPNGNRIPAPGTGRPSIDQLFRKATTREHARWLVAVTWPPPAPTKEKNTDG